MSISKKGWINGGKEFLFVLIGRYRVCHACGRIILPEEAHRGDPSCICIDCWERAFEQMHDELSRRRNGVVHPTAPGLGGRCRFQGADQ